MSSKNLQPSAQPVSMVVDGEDFSKQEFKASKSLKNFFDIIESFIYAIIAVLVIFTFFARLTIVDGESMESTLHHKEYLIVANVFFSYEPKNGDIVVVHGDFQNYYDNKYSGYDHYLNHNYSDPIVKRVIATGGQTVEIDYKTNTVTVDGVKLNEDYAQYIEAYRTAITLGEYRYDENGDVIRDAQGDPIYYPLFNQNTGVFSAVVPENHVFVMGDNRDHSADSRLNEIGFVPEEFIVGKAVFRLTPFNKMGGL
ncbi:MAG: signal peptidase I [Ruminococcaceae bacterium]|nr:signal peptidase I [Oscillospiraceae bacterium]